MFLMSQIVSEIIEEEVLQPTNEDIPHHPGFSSSKKYNKQSFQNSYQQYTRSNPDLRKPFEEADQFDSEDIQSKIKQRSNHYPHNVHQGSRQGQMRNDGIIGNSMGMNNEYTGDMLNMNNKHMGRPIGMKSEHMGDPQRMNNAHMGGPMGMSNGVHEHQNMGHYNHHGGQHIHNNNQHFSNINTNSNSWFSGTFGTLYEIMMIFFLVSLIYNCIFGRNTNDKHAMNWYNANRQYFEERYEHIGLNKAEMEELPQNAMMKDSIIV